MLQVDPSQKKLVAVLLVALAGAVVFLIVRLVPRDEPVQAAAQAARTASTSRHAGAADDVQIDMLRNPFERPAGITPAIRRVGDSELASDGAPSVKIGPYDQSKPMPGAFDVRPVSVPPFGGGKPGSDAADKTDSAGQPTAKEKAEKPNIKLLATIKSGGVYSAVLQVGDSQTRVVEVGDIVDGRYKITRLQDNMAVLVHGREVIIAKRPRS